MGWQRLVITPDQHQGNAIALTASQQHYLQRVLRLGAGDRFIALDGQGSQWIAALTPVADQAAILETLSLALTAQPEIVLAVALPKGSGFDEVVRQATELGVSCIQPVISDRTLLKPSANRLERWRRIATEATEQSERPVVPEIRPPWSWAAFLQALDPTEDDDQNLAFSGDRYLCIARGHPPHLLSCLASPPTAMIIAIGPEGGWTPAEIDAAIATQFQPVSLGPLVLRAVTAPLAALTLVQAAIALGKSTDHPANQAISGN